MKQRHQVISEDMYHRVYRLMNRDTDPRLIAAALHLPLRTVLNVIARLKRSQQRTDAGEPHTNGGIKSDGGSASFLDVYFLPKTRYAIVQLVGSCTLEQASVLETELQKVQASVWKAIAIRMTDVHELDEATARKLLDFYSALKARERYVALLDPSPEIEATLAKSGLEGTIPIFGTERAFEEEAFSHRGPQTQIRSRRSL